MSERFTIALVIIGGLGLFWLGWQLYKARLIKTISAVEATGKTTLLYFTAEYCAACKFQQSPVIEQLARKFGDAIAVRQVDVSAEPELASRYKVLTLPTTVVINPQGEVKHINYGVVQQTNLEAQLI